MLKNLGFPVISASRSKEQPYRIIRLNIVHGFALGRVKSEGCSWEIEHNLLGLNDNRGALRVIMPLLLLVLFLYLLLVAYGTLSQVQHL